MTKIYIYCLFEDGDTLYGVYSSLKSAHRDALKMANRGHRGVFIKLDDTVIEPTLKKVRNIFAGEFDIKIDYFSDSKKASVLKTKLKE